MPRTFLTSARYALRGIATVLHTERNVRIQSAVCLVVLLLGWVVRLEAWAWAAVIIAGGIVIVLELVNSAVERLLDLLKPRLHVYARDVKDILAGAVLVASVGAVAVGIVVFAPYLFGA